METIDKGLYVVDTKAKQAIVLQALSVFEKSSRKRKVRIKARHLPQPKTPIEIKREGNYIRARKNLGIAQENMDKLSKLIELNQVDEAANVLLKRNRKKAKHYKGIITRYEQHSVELDYVFTRKGLIDYFECDLFRDEEAKAASFLKMKMVGKQIWQGILDNAAEKQSS